VSEFGSHELTHHESGWKWANSTWFTLWWAKNFTTLFNSWVGGL